MKRRILGTAVAILSGLTLFACGGKKEEAKTEAPANAQEKTDQKKRKLLPTDWFTGPCGKQQSRKVRF